jgi:hypothetical protein
MTIKKKTTKKSAMQSAAASLGKRGGVATKEKYGKAHFQKMAEARWKADKKKD